MIEKIAFYIKNKMNVNVCNANLFTRNGTGMKLVRKMKDEVSPRSSVNAPASNSPAPAQPPTVALYNINKIAKGLAFLGLNRATMNELVTIKKSKSDDEKKRWLQELIETANLIPGKAPSKQKLADVMSALAPLRLSSWPTGTRSKPLTPISNVNMANSTSSAPTNKRPVPNSTRTSSSSAPTNNAKKPVPPAPKSSPMNTSRTSSPMNTSRTSSVKAAANMNMANVKAAANMAANMAASATMKAHAAREEATRTARAATAAEAAEAATTRNGRTNAMNARVAAVRVAQAAQRAARQANARAATANANAVAKVEAAKTAEMKARLERVKDYWQIGGMQTSKAMKAVSEKRKAGIGGAQAAARQRMQMQTRVFRQTDELLRKLTKRSDTLLRNRMGISNIPPETRLHVSDLSRLGNTGGRLYVVKPPYDHIQELSKNNSNSLKKRNGNIYSSEGLLWKVGPELLNWLQRQDNATTPKKSVRAPKRKRSGENSSLAKANSSPGRSS